MLIPVLVIVEITCSVLEAFHTLAWSKVILTVLSTTMAFCHIWMSFIQKSCNTWWWNPTPIWRNGAANKKWKRQDCVAGTKELARCSLGTKSPIYCYFFFLLFLKSFCITVLQDYERFLSRSQDLELQLSSKEKELEQLFQKQRRVGGLWNHVPPIVQCCICSSRERHFGT